MFLKLFVPIVLLEQISSILFENPWPKENEERKQDANKPDKTKSHRSFTVRASR